MDIDARWGAVARTRQSEACSSASGCARDSTGWSVLTFRFGSGNGLSEVSVFKDLPAALDSESPLIAFPGPVCVQCSRSARSVDGVADASFPAAHRFFAGFRGGLFGEVVRAAGCVVGDLAERGDVDRVVQLPVPVRVETMTNTRPRGRFDRRGRVVTGVVAGGREPADVTAKTEQITRDDRSDTHNVDDATVRRRRAARLRHVCVRR
jgi:hypothetical protein